MEMPAPPLPPPVFSVLMQNLSFLVQISSVLQQSIDMDRHVIAVKITLYNWENRDRSGSAPAAPPGASQVGLHLPAAAPEPAPGPGSEPESGPRNSPAIAAGHRISIRLSALPEPAHARFEIRRNSAELSLLAIAAPALCADAPGISQSFEKRNLSCGHHPLSLSLTLPAPEPERRAEGEEGPD